MARTEMIMRSRGSFQWSRRYAGELQLQTLHDTNRCLIGRGASSPRSKYKPRIPTYRRSRRFHLSLAASHFWLVVPSHIRRAGNLPPDHFRNRRSTSRRSLLGPLLQPLYVRRQSSLCLFSHMGQPQPNLLKRPTPYQKLPILFRQDKGS